MAVQLAKAAGCSVIVTSSATNVDFVKDLGADVVINYTEHASIDAALLCAEPVADIETVIDTVGGQTLYSLYKLASSKSSEAEKLFAANVRFVSVGCPLTALVPMAVCSKEELQRLESAANKKNIHSKFFVVRPDGAQLSKLLDLMALEKLKGYVRASFDLAKGKEAMELVEGKGGKGKVVLKVN